MLRVAWSAATDEHGRRVGDAVSGRAVGGASEAGALRRWQTAPLGEPLLLVGLAVSVGAVGGLGAVAFRLMIRFCRYLFVSLLFDRALAFAGPLHPYLAVLNPVAGLLLVGVISHYLASEVKGHGVPQILESLALRGGRIRPRVGFFGILAPAVTIGAEGSVGREGPIALIGAAFGSSIGQWLRLGDTYTSLLVACGAAAGIAATFNAPIAGGLFGVEVVLGSWAMGALVPVFVAAITGVLVFTAIMGGALAMPAPAYAFATPGAAALMLLLGVLGGCAALAYTRGLYFMEDLFDGWKAPWGLTAATGGLAVGLLGLALPQVLGVGYAAMGKAVAGQYGLPLLLALLVGKYLATLFTIGAGGSGGVFAPSLYLGAMLGGVFGAAAHALAPGLVPQPALFAVAGMGVVFAGAAQAPLTAMVIILEMTGDYHLTVGVVAACVLSYLLYGSLARDSMYTVKLSRRGIRILRGAEVRPLQRVPVTAAMRAEQGRLLAGATVQEAREAMTRARARALPVFRPDGHLLGIVDDLQLLQATEGDPGQTTVGSLCRTGVAVVPPTLSLDEAMRRFGILSIDLLPVGQDADHVLGTVSKDDVLRAYHQRTLLTLETSQKVALLREREASPPTGTFREVALPAEWSGAGQTVAALDLPHGVVLVSVHRGAAVIAPRGATVLQGGDRLLVYAGSEAALSEAEECIRAGMLRAGSVFREVALPQDWRVGGCLVAALGLPAGALLVAARRGGRVLIPRGDTRLQAGDVLTICAEDAAIAAEAGRLVLEGAPS